MSVLGRSCFIGAIVVVAVAAARSHAWQQHPQARAATLELDTTTLERAIGAAFDPAGLTAAFLVT